MAPLTNLLAEDVTLWADGGGKVKGAATRPPFWTRHRGALHHGVEALLAGDRACRVWKRQRLPALIVRTDERAYSIFTIEVADGHIQALRVIANPEKLARV